MTEEIFKCDHCNDAYFETKKALRGHQIKCRPKVNTRDEAKQERVPFGTPEQKWNTPSDDGFHYRVFNDNWRKEPGRVQRAMKAGYEVVENVESGTNVGTNDDGTEIRGVLMRIPDEFHKEDQAKKDKALDVIDKQIHGGKFGKGLDQAYGDVKINTIVNKE
jgi:hypothetical protein